MNEDPARENMPRTKELFGEVLKFDLQEGFPLLTTKKMYVKGIIEELLWFLRGSTDVSELIRKDCNIWNEDMYGLYKRRGGQKTMEEWVQEAKSGQPDKFRKFWAGRIYGHLWRNFGGNDVEKDGIDQIKKLVNMIMKNPDSRYQIVTAWDPTVIDKGDVALPSCHINW